MKKTLLLFWFSLGMSLSTLSAQQKDIQEREQLWVGYFNQTRFTDHWGMWLDLHLRSTDHFTDKLFQGIARVGLTYYFTDHFKGTAAYAYVHHFPGEGHTNIAQPEHRLWQQIQWTENYAHVRTMQWIRLEERYRRNIKNNDELAPGYFFNYRLRYNIALFVPLFGKKFAPGSFFLSFNDEIFINMGKNIIYNYFDQNRAFAGIGYQIAKTTNVQAGYMNVFQQQASGNKYYNTDAIRIFLFHNLDLRRQD